MVLIARPGPILLAALLVLAACGGDGGGSPSAEPGGEGTPGEPTAPSDGSGSGAPGGDGSAGGAPPAGDGGGAGGGSGGGGETPTAGEGAGDGAGDGQDGPPPTGEPDAGAAPGGSAGGGTPAEPAPGPGAPGGGSGSGGDGGAPGAAPGSTLFARTLGGAGVEKAVGPLAFGTDGSFVALSKFDYGPHYAASLGIARFSADGTLLWSKVFATGGDWVGGEALAISPLGNVFVALQGDGAMDLGAGPTAPGSAVVVKLAPGGRFVWQRTVPRPIGGIVVDAEGSLYVGHAGGFTKLRWDGVHLYSWWHPDAARFARVAVDPSGNVIVAANARIWKLDRDAKELWKVTLDTPGAGFSFLGTTAKGTVVAAGAFGQSLRFAGSELLPNGEYPGGSFVLAIESDGRPRWARLRGPEAGAVALDPVGRLAMLEGSVMFGCTDELMYWDLTGSELWRRPVATCDGDVSRGTFARGVGVAPSGAIWVQGDANAPFDVGTGRLVPRASDWFVLRVHP